MSTPLAAATAWMRAAGPTRTGTIRRRRADSIAPSSDNRSQGCTTAQLTGSSGSQRFSRRAKTSLRRSTISGVAFPNTPACASAPPRRRARQHTATGGQDLAIEDHAVRVPGRFSRTVTVAVISSPAWMRPSNSNRCETMRVPGPGNRRSSMPEMTASAATASTQSASCAGARLSSRWNGTTSPETSTSASISVCVMVRFAVALAPGSSSS